MNDVDRDFLRFRDRADVPALGRVYDATAGELLALATRLVGSAVDAEDIVQASFVAAIESAHTFDPARGVLPWLVGILTNRVRRWRRDRGRDAPLADPPQPGRLAAGGEPHHHLERREVDDQVARALDALPDSQRAVLALRLLHGMEPAEIAYALRRPPGTVRSQLARGLEHMRERLPKALAIAVLGTVPATRGLAAVRDAVLAHARMHTSSLVAAASGTCAVIMAKHVKLVGAGTLVLLLGTFGVLTWDFASPATEPRAIEPAPIVVRQTQTDAAPTTEPVPRPAEAPAPQRAPALAGAALRVRVEHEGRPIPGAVVEVRAHDGARGERRATDDDGVARYLELPPGPGRARLAGTAVFADYVPRNGTEVDLLLEAPLPGWVRGVVLFEPGGSAAGVDVWHGMVPAGHEPAQGVLRTAADGTFMLAVFGKASIGAHADARIPVHREVEVAPGATEHIELRLRAGGADLAGTVVDAATGGPLPGARIDVGDCFAAFSGTLLRDGSRETVVPFTAMADGSGRFTVGGLVPGSVRVTAHREGHAPAWRDVDIAAGARAEVRLELDGGAVVRGRVAGGDGKPVADVRIESGMGHMLNRARTSAARDGTYELRHLPAGHVRLRAWAPGRGEARTSLELRSGETTSWSPTLDARSEHIDGRLVDASGRALAGWFVVAHGDSRFDAGSPALVDAGGAFALGPFHGLDVVELRVHPPAERASDGRPASHPVLAERGVRIGSHDLVLVVPVEAIPSATVRGRLSPSSTGLVLRGDTGTVRSLAVDAGGAFRTGPLRPGRWEIVRPHFVTEHVIATFHLSAGEAHDAGVVEVPAQALGHLSVEIDTRSLPDDFVTEFGRKAAVQVLRAPSLEFLRWAEVGEGPSRIPLPPGRYLLRVAAVPLDPDPREIEVRAGETTAVVFVSRPAALRRLVFRHPGTSHPFERLDVEVRGADGRLTWSQVLQPREGWWLCEVALVPGEHVVAARTPAGLCCEATLRIEALGSTARPIALSLAPTKSPGPR